MLPERTFNVVLGSKGILVGFSFTPATDRSVRYRGEAITLRLAGGSISPDLGGSNPITNFLNHSRGAFTPMVFPNSFPGCTRPPPTPTWVDKPMRWAQLTLVEDDPGKFDPKFWLDYFKQTHSDAACLSAGGCVAYYPTQIPFHHRSAWLGDSDPFGELVKGCRKLNMVVVARTDPHATYDDVQAAHPDWIAVDANGKPRRHWASPEMWVTCGLGPYNFEFMTEVKKEIMSRYRVDAIFINRWDGSGMCYCEHCRKNFKDASGFDLPRTNNPQEPARRAYILWRQQRLFDLWQLWDTEVRKINPKQLRDSQHRRWRNQFARHEAHW